MSPEFNVITNALKDTVFGALTFIVPCDTCTSDGMQTWGDVNLVDKNLPACTKYSEFKCVFLFFIVS